MSTVEIKPVINDDTVTLEKLPTPTYATPGSAGLDLRADISECIYLCPGATVLIPTGIAVDMPSNLVGKIYTRSSLGHKHGIVLGNGTGIIDSDYQGQIFVSVTNRNIGGSAYPIQRGDRIAQIVFTPVTRVNLVSVNYFSSETERGEGGFGSTGTN